jgi:hypothetical protein
MSAEDTPMCTSTPSPAFALPCGCPEPLGVTWIGADEFESTPEAPNPPATWGGWFIFVAVDGAGDHYTRARFCPGCGGALEQRPPPTRAETTP